MPISDRAGLPLINVAYGIVVWFALMVTLAACPDPGRLMFVLTPVTFVMSLIGQVVYGGLLGHFSGLHLHLRVMPKSPTSSSWAERLRPIRAL